MRRLKKIHDALMDTYTRFGYDPILVPKDPVDARVDFILDNLKST